MIRKIAFALAATVALGAASLTVSTPASAWHGHGGWHGGWHGGYHHYWGPRFVYAGGGCLQRRVVGTPWGPRVRLVNVCY